MRSLAPICAGLVVLGGGAAHADLAEYAGHTCSFASTNDPSGAVNLDPNVQHAYVTAKWWARDFKDDNRVGINNSHETNAFVELACWIQVNSSHPGAAGFPSAKASGDGQAALEAVLTYTAGPTDNVFICTRVEMTHAAQQEIYVYDDDEDASNGAQCALAMSFLGNQNGHPGRSVRRV